MGRQKRSANTYTKINTIFYRDENNIIMPYDELVMPELEYLRNCKFDATEKIDGTNIRIDVHRDCEVGTFKNEAENIEFDAITKIEWHVEYKGKTDNSVIPNMLEAHLKETYPEDKVLRSLGLTKTMLPESSESEAKGWICETNGIKHFISDIPTMYTLYGEGYGVKVQACGANYLSNSNSFIGFDVKVDNKYLLRENMLDVFNKLGCPTVPYIGQLTIDEAIEYVKHGFKSAISENTDFLAEGLVLKSPCELLTRNGERICFKVKTRDWNKYFAAYGTYDKVEQKRNPNI